MEIQDSLNSIKTKIEVSKNIKPQNLFFFLQNCAIKEAEEHSGEIYFDKLTRLWVFFAKLSDKKSYKNEYLFF